MGCGTSSDVAVTPAANQQARTVCLYDRCQDPAGSPTQAEAAPLPPPRTPPLTAEHVSQHELDMSTELPPGAGDCDARVADWLATSSALA